MKRKLSWIMVLVLAIVSLGTIGTSAQEEQVIRWLAPGPGESSWEGLMQPVLDKFYEETGIRVISEHYAYSDLLEIIEVKLSNQSSDYDVITVDAPLVAAYAARGYLLPLDEYFSKERKQELTQASIDAGTWDGGYYSLPLSSSAQLLWYNTDLLEQAGVTVRENDGENRLTYEEVADMVRQVKEKLDPDGSNGLLGLDFQQVSRVYQMNPLANSMGGLNIGEGGYTLSGVLDSEPWIRSLEWYQEMVKEGICSRGITADEMPNYFYSEKLPFMIGATYIGGNASNAGMENYACTYLPAFEGYEDKVGSATGSWGFGVSAYSNNVDAAAQFIDFLSLGEGNDMWLEIRGEMPARNSVLEKIMSDDDAPVHLKMGAYEAIHSAVARAVTPSYNEYSTILDNLWEDVRNGEDVQEVVKDSIEQFDAAVKR